MEELQMEVKQHIGNRRRLPTEMVESIDGPWTIGGAFKQQINYSKPFTPLLLLFRIDINVRIHVGGGYGHNPNLTQN